MTVINNMFWNWYIEVKGIEDKTIQRPQGAAIKTSVKI